MIEEAGEKLRGPLERAADKHEAQQERTAKREGFWGTDEAQAIARQCLPKLVDGLKDALGAKARPVDREFCALIRDPKLKLERLALCILQGALQSIGKNETYADTAEAIGTNIRMECLLAKLLVHDRSLAKRIEQYALAKTSSPTRRQDKARAEAEKQGYKTDEWNDKQRLRAGNWAINQLLMLLPRVFARDDDSGQEKHLTLTPEAMADAASFVAHVIQQNPVWLPETEPPRRWTGLNEGGTWDPLLQKSLHVVRSWHKQTDNAVREAIRDGKMTPAIDALNALQAVPWRINKDLLEVIQRCVERGIEVRGLPPGSDSPVPERQDGLNADQESAQKERRREVHRRNRRRRNELFGLKVDLGTADALAKHERFWTPMNLDFRGRVNALPHFHFQRDDRVRALFLFADGEPIGEEGMEWLKVHLANRGDFDKVSKRPFTERIAWVKDNRQNIEQAAAAPLNKVDWWGQAAEPFQFLAACFDLTAALSIGPSYVSHLPVSFDGSCSGLQHLCAMTRAPEGYLVNLVPHKEPQDIYQTVAEATLAAIQKDTNKEDADCRRIWLDYHREHGITRSTVKQTVMTYGYSGTIIGMTKQQLDDIVDPLDATALLNGKPRPFGDSWEQRRDAARYLVKHTYAAIERTVKGPAEAKAFLRNIANAASEAGSSVRWTTPIGIPLINRYYLPLHKPTQLWLHDRGVYTTKRVVGERPKINKTKAANAIAPNLVHACDAAHLLRTVNAAVAEGVTSIATVHDCFGCLPSQADRFRKIIREQFVEMYERNDVLAQVLDQARKDLDGPQGPT